MRSGTAILKAHLHKDLSRIKILFKDLLRWPYNIYSGRRDWENLMKMIFVELRTKS